MSYVIRLQETTTAEGAEESKRVFEQVAKRNGVLSKIAMVTTSLHAINGIAERRIKETQERARSTLSTTHVCTRRSGGMTANLRAYAIRTETRPDDSVRGR